MPRAMRATACRRDRAGAPGCRRRPCTQSPMVLIFSDAELVRRGRRTPRTSRFSTATSASGVSLPLSSVKPTRSANRTLVPGEAVGDRLAVLLQPRGDRAGRMLRSKRSTAHAPRRGEPSASVMSPVKRWMTKMPVPMTANTETIENLRNDGADDDHGGELRGAATVATTQHAAPRRPNDQRIDATSSSWARRSRKPWACTRPPGARGTAIPRLRQPVSPG